MRTRDTEYLYATTRIRSLERTLLNEERKGRMLEAQSFEDLVKMLSELGYGDMQNATPHDVERALAREREATFRLLSDLAPNGALVDAFRIRYDYHNIKAILKGDAAGTDPKPLLIDAGRYSAQAVSTALQQMEYRMFSPVLRRAIEQTKETLSRTGDPQRADFILDQAYFEELQDLAAQSESKFLQGYVTRMIDLSNLRALVRAWRQKKDAEFLRGALVSGGSVDSSWFLQAIGGDTAISELFSGTALEEAAEEGARAASGETGLTRFETLCDNALIEYLRSARFVAFGDAPLVAYLAAKEADITALRILMAGKLQELPAEEIQERLRASYV